MRTLLVFAIAVICAWGFSYFHPDVYWNLDGFSDAGTALADMNGLLPHAVLPSFGNRSVDLSSYKGKTVLIVFWTTWCAGCVEEIPELIRLQNEFGDKEFTVVAIAVDDEGDEPVETFVKRRFEVGGASATINYPVLLGNVEIAAKLGFEGGLPASVLVNPDGTALKIIRGTVSESGISKAIRHLVRN